MEEKKIQDGCSFLSGFAFKSSEFSDEGVSVIKIANIQDKVVRTSGSQRIPTVKIGPKLNKFQLKDGDILIAMTGQGSVGRVGKLLLNKDEKALLNQRVGKFICDERNLNKGYLYYVISSKEYEKYLFDLALGSGQPNLSPSDILNVEIPFPDYDTQTRIAEILSVLDNKIELNRRMNETLEQMAQTLFRHYFVDGIDGENLPKGWSVSSLDKIANFLNGLALQKFKPKEQAKALPIIKIRELKNGITSSTEKADSEILNQYIINDGDVLFSWSGTLEVDIWCHGKGALNQHLFKVSSEKFPKWFYYFWVKEHLREFKDIAASKATTMGHIKRGHLTEAEVFTGPNEHLEMVDKLISPLIQKSINCKVEIGKLTKLRDTLLPKLMSGEIDVMQAQKDYEPVLS